MAKKQEQHFIWLLSSVLKRIVHKSKKGYAYSFSENVLFQRKVIVHGPFNTR